MSIFEGILGDIFPPDPRTPEQRKEAWVTQRMKGHGNIKPCDRAEAERQWNANQEWARKEREQKAKREAAKARREAVNEANRVKIQAEWKRKEAERVEALPPDKRAEYDRYKRIENEQRVESARESVRFMQDRLAEVLRETGTVPDTAWRSKLIGALEHFADVNEGERSNAADAVERIRAKLGLAWAELIVP